ncbi:hypothetical protein M405DRAFT_862111 [Rhizopogon salebrosus TDB-379]|nr:hypothetical protein M405DRAFT_862111 [Rhizopogon salebrosus TDB-379]
MAPSAPHFPHRKCYFKLLIITFGAVEVEISKFPKGKAPELSPNVADTDLHDTVLCADHRQIALAFSINSSPYWSLLVQQLLRIHKNRSPPPLDQARHHFLNISPIPASFPSVLVAFNTVAPPPPPMILEAG